MAHNVSYLPGGKRALGVRLDANHVRDGRWTPEEYADTRRYRAEHYELGADIADALVWSAEHGRYTVYGWREVDGDVFPDSTVAGIPNGQYAQVVVDVLALDGYDTDIERED